MSEVEGAALPKERKEGRHTVVSLLQPCNDPFLPCPESERGKGQPFPEDGKQFRPMRPPPPRLTHSMRETEVAYQLEQVNQQERKHKGGGSSKLEDHPSAHTRPAAVGDSTTPELAMSGGQTASPAGQQGEEERETCSSQSVNHVRPKSKSPLPGRPPPPKLPSTHQPSNGAEASHRPQPPSRPSRPPLPSTRPARGQSVTADTSSVTNNPQQPHPPPRAKPRSHTIASSPITEQGNNSHSYPPPDYASLFPKKNTQPQK